MKKDNEDYRDIINMPRHISKKHPQMSKQDRAVQFAPFAALTGHKERILETERLTVPKKELDENQKEIINNTLQEVINRHYPLIQMTYFIKDKKKAGGCYISDIIQVKKIDYYENKLVLMNGDKLPIEDIYTIEIVEKQEHKSI